jgi:argonaute-like protein implicated in RNA metabolism and viral defense
MSLDFNASRIRADRDQSMAEYLASEVFPIALADLAIYLVPEALQLVERRRSENTLQVATIREPKVEFNHKQETDDIRDGITRYGSVDRPNGEIELIPICTADQRNNMAVLINRLQTGKFKYRGSEQTFGAKFIYQAIHFVDRPESAYDECERLLKQHPDWVGDTRRRRLFLVHSPEASYSSDDEGSPYFTVKRLLLESGVPCQMLDTPTLINPDWKDLNLALNIVAKCGFAPWVLSGGIPDADFFVGLSYTQSRKDDRRKLIGFANVFNRYGKWIFYSSSTDAFDYDDRANHFASLTQQTLAKLQLPDSPSIHFHYSARFGKDDRNAVLKAAREVRFNGSYSFVSINTHHNVRLFDGRPETNGSLSRGRYVIASPKQILLSTSGYNPYRKMMGTPQMLEITLWCEDSRGHFVKNPDLAALAKQILSLTKLNWASTDSVCAEPITTKFAGDIAYLTDKFLRQGKPFQLHKALEQTPWFI